MPIVTGSHSRYNFSNWCYIAQHKFNAGWEPQENKEKHVGILQLDHALFICGYKVPFTEFHLIARQVCVMFRMAENPFFNEGMVFYDKMHRNLRLQGQEVETWPLLFKGCNSTVHLIAN